MTHGEWLSRAYTSWRKNGKQGLPPDWTVIMGCELSFTPFSCDGCGADLDKPEMNGVTHTADRDRAGGYAWSLEQGCWVLFCKKCFDEKAEPVVQSVNRASP